MPGPAESHCRGAFLGRASWIALFAWAAAMAQTPNIDEMVRPLAAHVPEWLPARTAVTVQCVNRTQAKETDFTPVCRAFSREVQRQGFPLGAHDVPITFTASENANGRLLIAQAESTDGTKVAIASWAVAAAPAAAGTVRLERAVLLESPTAALDFAVVKDGAMVVVLEPAAVALYNETAAGWELVRREVLPLTKPMPRDVRGRLITNGTGATAYLPGTVCSTEELGSRPFSCSSGDAGWSIAPGVTARWVAGRNYFQTEAGAAYTAGAVAADRLMITAVDGALKLTGLRGEPVTAMAGYGSDAAVVEQPCGTFAVAMRGGDAAEGDQLIPVDVRNNRLENAGAPLAVPGPVTALWPAETRADAHVIVRNGATGMYELSRAGVQCGAGGG